MNYQVLARKWRPRTFGEMVGQEHVLRALSNALDRQQLHHGYLFTGTRGVGKTTVARIFAKCLNCEEGIGSRPCGVCGACREIAEGRFLDLIEVDAASRTKVEDTRELLENVQYAPARGRFKVYLIDEVHMLSSHSFNALLKTLEEPPPHVKFLLATTDPQKLPVTVLSRCLQFNLKNLSPEQIVAQLRHVLAAEKVPVEEGALWALARAADGSMRDALSLTDQAIAHGGGKLSAADVGELLGTVDRGTVLAICQALARRDPAAALALVEPLAERGGDYSAGLGEMLSIWHRVALLQLLPEAADSSDGDAAAICALAQQLSAEDVQLFYQICLLGRRDLPLGPDPRTGFEMVLLRLLAFQPVEATAYPDAEAPAGRAPAAEAAAAPKKSDRAASAASAAPIARPTAHSPPAGAVSEHAANAEENPVATSPTPVDRADQHRLEALDCAHWLPLFDALGLTGVLKAVAAGLELIAVDAPTTGPGRLRFRLDERDAGLYDPDHQRRLGLVLAEFFQRAIEVEIVAGAVEQDTPRRRHERLAAERRQAALRTLREDSTVRELVARFSGQLLEDTVTPADD